MNMKKLFSLLVMVLGLNFGLSAQESTIPNPDPNAPDIKFENEV